MIVGIAHIDEALRRRRRRADPRVERRQVDIVVGVHHVEPAINRHPVLLATFGGLQDLGFGRVLGVELLQVVGGTEEEERCGARLALDEVRVGLLPRVLDGKRVDDLDLRRLAVDQKLDVGTAGGEVLVVGDVFPEEAEILGSEGLAVRPFVPGAQLEGELAAVLLLVALEDVRLQLELVVVDDEARVAEDRHQTRIARAGHQHVELAALLAGTVATGKVIDHPGLLGNALVDRRQGAGLHLIGEHRRFLERGHWIGGQGGTGP